VGDVGSCVSALLAGMGGNWAKPPADWINAITERKTKNVAKMAETLGKNPSPMNFHSALAVVRDVMREKPDTVLVNEGANALDFTRSIVDMYKPRKRLDVGTWAFRSPQRSRPASRCCPLRATALLASRAWKSKPSAATTCRSVSWS
jgi:thiamine pyrophosphate-dependent acetolactate synthase large subunit-like protein